MPNPFEQLVPDIAGSFERGRAQVRQQQREQFADQELRARAGRENRFRELAGQAYGASPVDRQQIMSQAAAADPQGAMALEQGFGARDKAQSQALQQAGSIARRNLSIADPMTRRKSFRAAVMSGGPIFSALGPMDQQLAKIDAASDAELDQSLTALSQFAELGTGGVQSTIIGNDGQILTVMRDGRLVPTGQFAAPNMRVMEQEGQLPYGVVTGRGQAGQVVPFGAPGASAAPPGASPGPQVPPPMAAPPGAAPAPPGALPGAAPAMPPAPVPPPAGVGPVRIPTAAETAAATEQARSGVQLQMEPQIAGATTRAQEEAKAEAERNKVAQLNQTAFQQYRVGADNLQRAMSGTMTGPLAGRMPAVTSAQQIAEGAQAIIAPTLKQLFRSAGEGTFTDRDQQLLLDMLPTRKDHPEAARAKLGMIDQLVAAKLGVTPPNRSGAQPAPPASGGLGIGQTVDVGGFKVTRKK